MAELRQMLAGAERPLVIVGGSGWDAQACAALQRFAEAQRPAGRRRLPAARTSSTTRIRCYAGDVGIGINPKLAARVQDADLLLVVGARLGEMTTGGYTLLDMPVPRQTLVHVHAGAEELGRVYQPEPCRSTPTPREFRRSAGEARRRSRPALGASGGAARAPTTRPGSAPRPMPGALQMAEIMLLAARHAARRRDHHQRRRQLHRLGAPLLPLPRLGTQLAPTSGAMGYGVPAAVAAKLRHPRARGRMRRRRRRLPDERAGARHRRAIRRGADRARRRQRHVRHDPHAPGARLPGAGHGTDLRNPDFAALAEAYGAHGERVERTDDFAPAFERARDSGKAGAPAPEDRSRRRSRLPSRSRRSAKRRSIAPELHAASAVSIGV